MASYSLQTADFQLVWVARVCHHDVPKKFWSRNTTA